MTEKEILNIDEAARLLGVSVKTFNKVLHAESLPARKIGREWKFSRRALIDWVGGGRSVDFYRDAGGNGEAADHQQSAPGPETPRPAEAGVRRTSGWRLELD